jgi:hypothetical protein
MSAIILGQEIKDYILEQLTDFPKNDKGNMMDKYDMINAMMKVAYLAADTERRTTFNKIAEIADKEIKEFFNTNGDYGVGGRDMWHSIEVEWSKQ